MSPLNRENGIPVLNFKNLWYSWALSPVNHWNQILFFLFAFLCRVGELKKTQKTGQKGPKEAKNRPPSCVTFWEEQHTTLGRVQNEIMWEGGNAETHSSQKVQFLSYNVFPVVYGINSVLRAKKGGFRIEMCHTERNFFVFFSNFFHVFQNRFFLENFPTHRSRKLVLEQNKGHKWKEANKRVIFPQVQGYHYWKEQHTTPGRKIMWEGINAETGRLQKV